MKVVLDIAPDERGGWQTIRGTITGEASALAIGIRHGGQCISKRLGAVPETSQHAASVPLS